MVSSRGKSTTLWVCAASIVLLSIGLYASRKLIIEYYFSRQLESDDSRQRARAAERLADLGSLRVLLYLLDQCGREDGDLSAERAETLIGTVCARNESEAATALRSALQSDERATVRLHALRTLAERRGTLSLETAELVSLTVESTLDSDARVRRFAVALLGTFGGESPRPIVELEKILASSQETELLVAAANSLGALGSAAKSAAPALLEVLRNRDPEARCATIEALVAVGVPRSAKSDLVVALKSSSTCVRGYAAKALGQLGSDARDVAETLLALVGDDAGFVQAEATAAIVSILSDDAVPLFVRGLQSAETRVREQSAAVLGRFGAAADSAVPALKRALKDESQSVRQAAQRSLATITRAPDAGER
ncbi:MAG: HEAT repeat domain-containing protein [Armatimonadetes bacterium]|nr:HEAT repeat domain-containing protein [Armatimonadota bacterium]